MPAPTRFGTVLGNGSGGFGAAANFPAGHHPDLMITDDFNGDGSLDLASANLNSDDLSVLLGDGAGGVRSPAISQLSTRLQSPRRISNGDGAPDLASRTTTHNNASVLLNTTGVSARRRQDHQNRLPAKPPSRRHSHLHPQGREPARTHRRERLVTDTLPRESPSSPPTSPCLESAGNISCELGAMGPGRQGHPRGKGQSRPVGHSRPELRPPDDVQRVEAPDRPERRRAKTVQVSCPSGFFATDGSVRIDHIDQGTGDWTAPQVLESRAISAGTWQGTVKNTAPTAPRPRSSPSASARPPAPTATPTT